MRGVIIEIERREEEGDVRERDVRHIGAEIPGADIEERKRSGDREPAVVSSEREAGEVASTDMKTGAADIPAGDPAVAHERLEFVVRVRKRDRIGKTFVSAAVNEGAGDTAAPGEAVLLVSVVVVPGGVLGVNRQHNRRIALLHNIGEAPALVAEPAADAVLTAVLRDHARRRGFIDSGEGAGEKSIGPGGQSKCGQHGRKCQFSFKKHRRRREMQLFFENN